jgi:GTP-binding protein LepA
MSTNLNKIRNFCIIAHIDHGKSTLADRFLELTRTVSKREMRDQYLDQMDLEREKGITIKLQPVRMEYKDYVLNLIDTPGHVDFSYEVSRSLACCEGALLVVDATRGIQAQTLANLYQALEHDLEIIPIINKIDLPNADIEKVSTEIVNVLGCKREEVFEVSAKRGAGVKEVLDVVISKISSPKILENGISKSENFRSLIFDSVYDEYQGVIAYVRIFDGKVKKGEKVKFMATNKEFEVLEVGVFKPGRVLKDELSGGEVGYIITGLKDMDDCRVGDTIAAPDCQLPLPGYKKIKPVVFASFYPTQASDFSELKDGLAKLKLNDAALQFEPEISPALGRGFRCGFLGLLHLEIIQERLKRESGLSLIISSPSVVYKITKRDGQSLMIYTPTELPDQASFLEIKEPWTRVDIITPIQCISQIMELTKLYRGIYKTTEYLVSDRDKNSRIIVHFEIPLSSVISDFYDRLKSVTSGFASLNYEIADFRPSDLVRLDILVAGEKIDAFSRIVAREKVYHEGKALLLKLKEVVPKQSFQVALQAVLGGKIIARENISALRKDVTAKLYGGDATRKMKLLEKQKRGKRKMKTIGKVRIPQEAFLAVLKK